MREFQMTDDFRLMQVFLPQSNVPGPGIYEVSVGDDDDFNCTCPGFSGRARCKHVAFVKARIETNNGTYPLEISSRATTDDAAKAQKSSKDFREFIIKFGKVEVL
jgi:SWIM zinc finger